MLDYDSLWYSGVAVVSVRRLLVWSHHSTGSSVLGQDVEPQVALKCAPHL